jgi:acyl-CoA dehydrogenase family protein 9
MREQSFMKSLFSGSIEERQIFPWREPELGEVDALHVLLKNVGRLCGERVDSGRIDREAHIPDNVLHGFKELGCFGLLVPRAYGGAGLSNTGYGRVIQEIAGFDASIAVTLGAHQSLGLRGLLLFGTEAQKARYLPRLAAGELIAAFALSELGAGSDPAAIQTHAERQEDGSYVVTGSKAWITNGGLADVFTVFARTSPTEDGTKPRITAFVIERGAGVSSGPNQPKLGIRGSSTTEVLFDHVRVPFENVLGGVGRGYRVATDVLDGGRLGLASGCLGLARRAIQMSVERCRARRAFGDPIGEFGIIKDKIASMIADTWALESVTYLTTGMVDTGARDFAVESATCKVVASETCWRVVNEALQIAASAGYMADHPYERLLRDARVNLIFEGTNEILRANIALSGMRGPGRALADVARATRRPIPGIGLLRDVAVRRAKSAFGRDRMTQHHPALQRQALIFEEYVHALSRGADKALRRHGTDIAEMQYTQKRAADIAIDLYAIAACVTRATRAIERRGEEGAKRELDFTTIFVSSAQRRLAENVAAIEKNDDELRKAVASRAYADGGYSPDVL